MAKNKINELRAQRAKTWESAKAFLDSHRNDKGILSAEDTHTYEQMEQEIVDLGHEIERQERLDAMEREMALPVNTPITGKPQNPNAEEKTGRASDEYKKNFWNVSFFNRQQQLRKAKGQLSGRRNSNENNEGHSPQCRGSEKRCPND